MKRLGLLIVFVLVLIAGGGLTSGMFNIPVILQTADPEASAFVATPGQAELFFLWVGFVIINVLGAGATIALIVWLLDRAVRRAQGSVGTGSAASAEAE